MFPAQDGRIVLEAEVLERGQFGERLIEFAPVENFFGVLEQIGHVPLPPYIHRDDAAADRERYQTVFSHERGIGGGADGRTAFHDGDAESG